MRAVLSYEVTDRYGDERAKVGITENLRSLEHCSNGSVAENRVAVTFGLQMPAYPSVRVLWLLAVRLQTRMLAFMNLWSQQQLSQVMC